jgi:hypothetical protein
LSSFLSSQNLLLEEQARLKLELEATIAGHPVALPSTEDSVMDSKTWATTGPRFIAASQQHSLQSPNFESETCTMGSSIEPAESSRIYSQQTNSHPAAFGALMMPLMCATMAMG